MPASDFSWPSFPRVPIFQVFGTKRKASADPEGHSQPNTETTSSDCKRMCMRTDIQPVTSKMNHMPLPEINHNCLQQSALDFQQQQPQYPLAQQQHFFPDPLQNDSLQVQNGATSIEFNGLTSENAEQPAMLMDLTDETYSNQAAPDLDAINMEADCSPDPAQYIPARQSRVEDDNRSEFHELYCGAGDRSPTTGRVRCYCKPSWEGMMDLRPYISDVY